MREMQARAALTLGLVLLRKAGIREVCSSVEGLCRKKNTFCSWWECESVEPLWKPVRRCLKNWTIAWPDYTTPLTTLGCATLVRPHSAVPPRCPMIRELCCLSHQSLDIHVYCSVHNSNAMDPTLMPVDRQVDNESLLHTTTVFYLAVKSEKTTLGKGLIWKWLL